jgi:hypothetical protein
MRALFIHAFLALLISLTVIALLAFEVGKPSALLWSASVGALVQAPVTAYFCRLAVRNFRDPETTTGWGAFVATAGGTSAILVAFVTGAAEGGELGWLVSAVSGQLLFGLWVFTRMLLHRN